MAVAAPIPSARVKTMTAGTPGFLAIPRAAYRRSCPNPPMFTSLRVGRDAIVTSFWLPFPLPGRDVKSPGRFALCHPEERSDEGPLSLPDCGTAAFGRRKG